MITISDAPSALEHLSLFQTTDALLDHLPVLVFYGPSTIGNSTNNSSRIQAHVYSLAGFQSFPRLTIAPTSPLYAAVKHLPLDQQGDEVSRGLAVSLLSYFAGLSKTVKDALRDRAAARRHDGQAPMMFDEMHAGDLASNLTEIEDSTDIAKYVENALAAQVVSWMDMHVVLPQDTIQRGVLQEEAGPVPLFDDDGLPLYHFGRYNSVVEQLGSPTFLPTSKIQRAPSRPTAHSRSKILSKDQKIALRRELCELIDTEKNYINKMHNLNKSVAVDFQHKSQSAAVLGLFPKSAIAILEVNDSFYNDIQAVVDATENEAIKDIEHSANADREPMQPISQSGRKDATGITEVAQRLLKWLPKFISPYRDYLRASSNFSTFIAQILADYASIASKHLQDIGEQRLRSALIEPVQRLPRYSLFIDNIIALLPRAHPALASLLKAKDLITDICALDAPTAGDNIRATRILKKIVQRWPEPFVPTGRLKAAVDAVVLGPPFVRDERTTTEVILVFATHIVILQKANEGALTARGIIAEVDRPSTSLNAIGSAGPGTSCGLTFLEAFPLADLNISESENSRSIRFTCLAKPALTYDSPSEFSYVARTIALFGPYDGKASKFVEEVIKARIEGIFIESVRESDRWALRSVNPTARGIGLISALSDGGPDDVASPNGKSCQIRVHIDGMDSTKEILDQCGGGKIAASISVSGSGEYHLKTESIGGTKFADDCTKDNIATVLIARGKPCGQCCDRAYVS